MVEPDSLDLEERAALRRVAGLSTELEDITEVGSLVLEGLVQRRSKPDTATYIGSGKAAELRDVVLATGADTVICDGELTPGQLRKLEAIVKVKVVDRTWLILDIFAQHARSREGKAQVSLAQMEYLLAGRAARPGASELGDRVRRRSRLTDGESGRRCPSCAVNWSE